jgi:hypothetical protein
MTSTKSAEAISPLRRRMIEHMQRRSEPTLRAICCHSVHCIDGRCDACSCACRDDYQPVFRRWGCVSSHPVEARNAS